MNEAETIGKIVEILRTVPPCNLEIIALANKIPIDHGEFDAETLSAFAEEIHMAVKEAEAYGEATMTAVSALVDIRAIPEGGT